MRQHVLQSDERVAVDGFIVELTGASEAGLAVQTVPVAAAAVALDVPVIHGTGRQLFVNARQDGREGVWLAR